MTTLAELTARVAISELKARYFRAVDTKDWEAFEALFEEDATLAAVDDLPGVVFRGRAAIRAGVADSLETAATVHRGHMPEIWFDNPDQAQGFGRWKTSCSSPNAPLPRSPMSMGTATITSATAGWQANGGSSASSCADFVSRRDHVETKQAPVERGGRRSAHPRMLGAVADRRGANFSRPADGDLVV